MSKIKFENPAMCNQKNERCSPTRAAKIMVVVYPLFLQLACLNSIFFRQNPFKLSEMSDSSKIAREPTPFGQENYAGNANTQALGHASFTSHLWPRTVKKKN